jgi:hypothetical protein
MLLKLTFIRGIYDLMIPINIDLSRISQGNTKLKLGGLDNLSKLDNGVKSDISVHYFSVLIELKISFSYLSAPEIKSSKVELIVFGFDKAHKIVLFFSKFVFEKSVKLALIAYSVSCDLVWSEFVIGCSSLIHPNIDINDFNFVVITNIEVGVAYSKMFDYFKERINITVFLNKYSARRLSRQDTYRIYH